MMRGTAGMIAGLALTGCAIGAGQYGDKELLAYAGAEGDRASYVARQTLRGRITLNGMPHLAVIETKAILSEAVEGIYPDGSRRIALSYGVESLEVNGAQAEIASELKDLRFGFLRSEAGKIGEVSVAGPAGEGLGLMMQSLEMFFPAFPAYPVSVGERWKQNSRVRMGDSSVATESSGKLLRFEEVEGVRCAVIGFELNSQAEEEAKEGAPADAVLRSFQLSLSGKFHFAAPGGYVVKASHRGRMKLDASRGDLPVGAELMFIVDFERMPGQ